MKTIETLNIVCRWCQGENLNEIKKLEDNPNVVAYIVGLGNPDDAMMARAATLCGGEYFKPEDAGELLVWYSKRARDLTVKMKAHKDEF